MQFNLLLKKNEVKYSISISYINSFKSTLNHEKQPTFLTYPLCYGKFYYALNLFVKREKCMDPRFHIGRILIVTGIVLVVVGLVIIYTNKIPLLGRLPGDINIRGKNWSFHFPIVTGLILSLILTFLLNLFLRR